MYFVLCCDRGVINTAAGVETSQSTCPLVHCHTAVGHSKAVLSVFEFYLCVVLCYDRGVINTAAGVETSQTTCPLVYCHTAVGHSKAVLSVFATDTCLYTASKGMLLISFTSSYCHQTCLLVSLFVHL